jgi:hypothetical protein
MRIVEELSSFYRHIYLNLPGFTRLVRVADAGAALRFGVFPANLYKIESRRADSNRFSAHYECATRHLGGTEWLASRAATLSLLTQARKPR